MANIEEFLVQESTVPIVSDGDPSCPAVRSAHFLLPRAGGSRLPTLPSPCCNAGPVLEDGLRVEFKGWARSSKLWRRWVDKLRPRHESLWRKVGILDAVLATAYRVRRGEGTLVQLAAFWSGDTNTFMFPWGEATVTLEDMAVLGGLPLFGKPVRARLPDALLGDVEALKAVRSALNESKYKKPYYAGWVKYFLERPQEEEATGGGETADLVEHGAFLAMWLSLFVFAARPFDVVRPQVLPIAARLARGQRMALASAALTSIYSDLSALKRFLDLREGGQEAFQVRAPTHILLLWVWERFPELRPDMGSITPGTDARRAPRAARWHDVHKALDPWYVHGVFMSPNKFEWRPYGRCSIALPPKKAKAGSWVHGQDVLTSNKLLSFTRCLRHCELVGMGCIEQYNPHRVARQFGFDQDVPGIVARANSNWMEAWGTYKFGCQKFALIVPHYKLGVTLEYARWWEPYSLACSNLVSNYANPKELPALFTPRKRKINELSGADSCKRRHVDSNMPLPGTNTMEDPLDEIPLIERLNTIIMVKGAKQEQIADVAEEFVPKFIRGKDKSMIIQQDAEQYLSDSRIVLDSSADESFCMSVTKTEQLICLPQSKQEAQDRAITFEVNSNNSGQVMIHHGIEGAASTGSNEAIEAATTADMLPTLEDIVVISDDDFDEEAYIQKDVVGAMHLKSPQMETMTYTLWGLNEELNLVRTKNERHEHDSPVSNEVMMERKCGYELDAFLLGAALQQETADATHVATVQIGVDLLQPPTEVMEDPRDKTDNEQVGALEGTEKHNEGNSASNHPAGSLIEACIEVSRKNSGNNDISSDILLNASSELVRTKVCTKTLYYLTTIGLLKNAHERDVSGTNRDQGVYQPRREVGTREMIEKSFAAREAEKVELETVIKYLKEQVAVLEVQLRNASPSKLDV